MAKRRRKLARKPGENKSQAIRDYVTANPEAGPTAVAEALNAIHGWSINAPYVSTIKNKMKEKQAAVAPSAAASDAATGAASSGVDEKVLFQVKKLAKEVGGIDQAKAALDLLYRLTS